MEFRIKQNKIFLELRDFGSRNEQKSPKKAGKLTENLTESKPNRLNEGMVLPLGYTLLDIDTQEQADLINKFIGENNLKALRLKTIKGMNFVFKTKYNLPSGEHNNRNFGNITYKTSFLVDGKYASYCYAVIRLGNFEGERLFEDTDFEEISEIPINLLPSMQEIEKVNKKLFGIKEPKKAFVKYSYSLIEDYLGQPTRKGRRFFWNCPFSNETTPSMVKNNGNSATCFCSYCKGDSGKNGKTYYPEDLELLLNGN